VVPALTWDAMQMEHHLTPTIVGMPDEILTQDGTVLGTR